MTKIIEEIKAERLRQISKEGWSFSHDDTHIDGEMARAAACYSWVSQMDRTARNVAETGWWETRPVILTRLWPWAKMWWKPSSPRRDLIKAAALIVAEIERLDRADAMIAERDQ